MRNFATYLLLTLSCFPSFATEYEQYYYGTPAKDFIPGNITLSDTFDRKQLNVMFRNNGSCLASPEEQLLLNLGRGVSLENGAIYCTLSGGTWLGADGQHYSDPNELLPVPMWTSNMVETYFDHTGHEEQTTKLDLLSILYSHDNWKLVPRNAYHSIKQHFPFDLNGADVSSCTDLKDFTIFGIINSLRFPKELSMRISRLEQYPECEKYLSLTEEDALNEINHTFSMSIMD